MNDNTEPCVLAECGDTSPKHWKRHHRHETSWRQAQVAAATRSGVLVEVTPNAKRRQRKAAQRASRALARAKASTRSGKGRRAA